MFRPKVFAVITGARPGKTVDIRARERRYLITMGFRVACFALIPAVPELWQKLALVVGAAILPGIGVLLANAVDQRASILPPPPEAAPGLPELISPEVIPGQVADEAAADGEEKNGRAG